ncbi:MAG TPA: TonB-dependent receptor plug domain-containing protein, partial [Polyangiaceae bacterium]|nr:TonB-dependent receptor plug domain-containing protein [Polyangiaceae bacterium]
MSKMRSGFLKLFPSCTAVFLLSLSTHAEAEQPPPAPEKAAEDTAPVNAASQSHTEATDLRLRPGNSTTNLGEAVPGLISAQHMGGGDADQWFLRGFNAGHGTDVAFFVDGVPVNAVSHGHGQGYSDLHFLIPELTTSVDGYKGSYETRFGDFATAGAVDIKLAEALPESFAQVSLGQYGMLRGVAIASPQLHDRWRTTLAAEIAKENGPYQTEEDLKRYNAFLRASYDMGARSKVTMTLMSYGSDWNAPGQIPARAVCDEGELGVRSPQSYGQPCIDRFGSADPTQGG